MRIIGEVNGANGYASPVATSVPSPRSAQAQDVSFMMFVRDKANCQFCHGITW
jgi:hypothetical protein